MSKIIFRFTIAFNKKSNLVSFENKSRRLHFPCFHIDQFVQGLDNKYGMHFLKHVLMTITRPYFQMIQ